MNWLFQRSRPRRRADPQDVFRNFVAIIARLQQAAPRRLLQEEG